MRVRVRGRYAASAQHWGPEGSALPGADAPHSRREGRRPTPGGHPQVGSTARPTSPHTPPHPHAVGGQRPRGPATSVSVPSSVTRVASVHPQAPPRPLPQHRSVAAACSCEVASPVAVTYPQADGSVPAAAPACSALPRPGMAILGRRGPCSPDNPLDARGPSTMNQSTMRAFAFRTPDSPT